MVLQQVKKGVVGIALALGMIICAGTMLSTTAQAQVCGRGYYQYEGYHGRYDYNAQREKGYRDGLNRGREDARDHRYFNPNNSSHYRDGNPPYREGFRVG